MKNLVLPSEIFKSEAFGIRIPVDDVCYLPDICANNAVDMFDYNVIAEWCINRKREGHTHIVLYYTKFSLKLSVCSEKWASTRKMRIVNVEDLLAPASDCPDFLDLL